ncbi:JmjC domain-containing protein [Glaciecola sp. SC05]|uniref:JmjC domain-containing protein n=1 Tax=Glaciecola sp. SC05 TaxID=1987355 RepID=UPI00352944A7
MNNESTHMQGLSMARFLRDYWQKRPCVIKQFMPAFVDPIDEHELAGLSQEDGVDSRLISNVNGEWQVTQGPIDDFEPLCKGAWTLLVQGVDRYVPDVDALSDGVKQIGSWRMDDVMVSFSSAGAGVGPHIDEYDVFIVQGKGTRRWQVGLPCDHETFLPHPLLKQITPFTPLIDEVLASGDAIYIPPKHPHNGIAVSECLNYSIGFRAPTNLEVLNGLVDEGEDLESAQQRYTDPELHEYRDESISAASITDIELNKLKRTIQSLLDSEQAQRALMQSISRQGLADMSPETLFDQDEVLALLENGEQFVKAPGVKPIYAQSQSEGFRFYIDAQEFAVPSSVEGYLKTIIDRDISSCSSELDSLQINTIEPLIRLLLNQGYLDIA